MFIHFFLVLATINMDTVEYRHIELHKNLQISKSTVI